MITIISFILTVLTVYIMRVMIKKNVKLFYMGSTFIGVLSILFSKYPFFLYIINGYIGLDLFMIVMMVGALNRKNKKVAQIYAIRGVLSIIGFILLTPHAIIAFVTNINTWANSFGNIIGIIAYLIMIPLFLTSFMKIRKKVGPKDWKALHKWSYFIYFGTFLHLYFLSSPFNQMFYTLIFMTYSVMRFNKAFPKKQLAKVLLASSLLFAAVWMNQSFFSSSKQSSIALAANTYQDGTYTGTGTGFQGRTVSVKVTIKNNKITNIVVTNSGSTGGRYASIVNSVAKQIVSSQSLKVDSSTGATHSTTGLYQAVNNALKKALIS